MKAVYNGSGLQYYRHSDWLGTNRFSATPSGTVYFDGAYAPYAENYAGIGTSDRVFTGQPIGTLPGLYDFTFREYGQSQGRWLVPDPAGLAAVDITNPQTWNRYAYAMNNPLSYIDPLGLYLCIINGVETDRGCPGTSGAPGAGGGGGYPIYVTGTCQSPYPNNDGGAVYQSCLVLAGYTNGFGSGPGGGGGSGPSGPANNGKSAADVARCAGKKANSVSLAALLPDGTPTVVSNILGNDFSTISNLITGPGRGSAAASVLEGKAFNAGVRAVGAVQYTADRFVLGANAAGATFARDMIPGTLTYSLAGKIVTKLSTAKLIYDAATYVGAAAICYASPD
jgi:RHS repeat-associated protein